MKTRILLVEDDNDISRIIQLAMKTLGLPYELDIAMSAEEGLALWNKQPYDLVLTDYNLRGMTGLDLITQVRRDGYTIPTILFTAYDSPSIQRSARESGATAYIAKPFFMDDLVEKVRTLLPHHFEELGGATSQPSV
jgi:two-component system, OmpR family, response regulator